MHDEVSKRILLVGASGFAGRKLATFLLKDTDATVILAGRSRAKLDAVQSGLQQDTANRVELLELDAAHFDASALGEFDLLVNATAEGPHNIPLIQACLERRADWIDMQLTNELLDPPAALREDIENAGSCFIIQAGFHPGLLAPLVRYAALQMDVMSSAIVGSVIRDDGGLPFTAGFAELVESFRNYTNEIYKDGRWQKIGYTGYPKIEFEYGFGELVTYPVEMPELRRLVELLPDVKDTGFFVAGFNWFADYVVTPLIMIASRIAPQRALAPLGHMLSWSTRTLTKPPYGTVVQVDAEGRRGDLPVYFRLALYHEDAYVVTAISTVAMIKQMLPGDIQPGIHLMGLCCDPLALVEHIEGTEISLTQRSGCIR